MPTYATPGVYVEEVPARNKPIEGVSTSTAAFVGLAPGGPLNRPVQVSNWSQFERMYTDPANPGDGPFMEGAYLAHAVNGFFANGGTLCWVVRVSHTNGNGAAEGRAPLPAASNPKEIALLATAKAGVEDYAKVEVTVEPPQPKAQGSSADSGADDGKGSAKDDGAGNKGVGAARPIP